LNQPTILERAFALAASGRFTNLQAVKVALKNEGFPDYGHLSGPRLRKQVWKIIRAASPASKPSEHVKSA